MTTAASPSGRLRRIWRGPDTDPAWARPALFALLLATGAFYVIGLTSNGWANSFYSAAVQAGSQSWKAFLFGSSDAGNSITVDKPPASLWVMALSVRIFGLSSFSILLPEVLMGVATVGVVHATVKRCSTAAAGLLAGAVLALTPVAVLMFRFNNPEALLVLLMTLGAWATMRSVEQGSPKWMAIVGVFIGLGFLTKALQVLLVVPFFGLGYVLFANTTLRRRIVGAIVGVGAMLLSAGWWVAIVELIPASMRPYIGGSQDNSFLSVTFGYNGLGRLSGSEVGSVGGGQRGPGSGTESITRLFTQTIGGQISWLLPTAALLLIAGLAFRGRRPRTDLRRAAYVVWGGWLLVTGLVFSLMAGIFYEYYTVALAPAIAALVGMGACEAWDRRTHWAGRGVLAAAAGTAAGMGFWLLGRTTAYGGWLRWSVLVVGFAAALLLLLTDRLPRFATAVTVGGAVAAALAGPTAYAVTTVTTPHTGSIVTAGPNTGGPGGMGRGGVPGGGMPRGGFPGGAPGGLAGGMPGGMPPAGFPGGSGQTGGRAGANGMGGLLNASTPSAEVVAALRADASSYRWAAATVGSQNAAGLQLGSGEPVMPIGGFNGSDPSPTLDEFKGYVASGDIHYFMGGGGFRGQNGGGNSGNEISSWVQANFTQVSIGGTTMYDLTQPLSTAGTAS